MDISKIKLKNVEYNIKDSVARPIELIWEETSNINDITVSGLYEISGVRTSTNDNLPIYNTGSISARLLVTENENCVSQVLTLLNVGGGDINVYTRVRQNEGWEQWGKLQTNIEVGLIGLGQSKTFDDLVDNGMYSGVNAYWQDPFNYITGAETFVLVVVNGYLYGAGITQLKYSIKTDRTVGIFTREGWYNNDNIQWTDWKKVGSDIATEDIAGIISERRVKELSKAANQIIWDANSNMNNFKTPGIYDIYGERTVKTDNLPITNEGGGNSIAARLTVVASTLQPANNEICVTQFLQLSNRIGGEGTTYVRTYNENNNGMNGWSPWQKQMGMVETLINSDYETVGQEIFNGTAEKIGQGLSGMIDNGMYSGMYIDNISYTGSENLYYLSAQPTFVETFVLIVINDYAATGKLGLPRHITQLKYAVDAITGQSTVKKRVGTDDGVISWSDWTDIGGGGSSVQEVDITDAVKAAGLPALIAQGLAKEGITYKVTCDVGDIPVLDTKNKIKNHIDSSYHDNFDDKTTFKIYTNEINQYNTLFIDCYIGGGTAKYYKYIITYLGSPDESVKVSVDMTEL